MNYPDERAIARQICIDAGVDVFPHGNAWWLLGNGINRVVGELAGLTHADLLAMPLGPR